VIGKAAAAEFNYNFCVREYLTFVLHPFFAQSCLLKIFSVLGLSKYRNNKIRSQSLETACVTVVLRF